MKRSVAVFGIDTTRRFDRCIAYDVAEDPYEKGLVRFFELWPDHVSHVNHLKAAHLQPWRAAARGCGLMERRFTAYDITSAMEV